MKQYSLHLLLLVLPLISNAQLTKFNFTSTTLDGNCTTFTINYVSGVDFPVGSLIDDVNVTVEMLHNGTCPVGPGSFGFNEEIAYQIASPTGTTVRLIVDAYNSLGQGASVIPTYQGIGSTLAIVTLDDSAASLPSGDPTTGSFQPKEALSAFNGQSPFGTWTLTVCDGNSNFPLCHNFFSLTIAIPALPVELVSFTARQNEKNAIDLHWTTASEINNQGFELQQSRDGKNWKVLGFIAGQGTISTAKDYFFQDTQPVQGLNYYRLKQMDYDGQFSYSPIVTVQAEMEDRPLFLYPNPVAEGASLQVLSEKDLNGTLSLFNTRGQIIKRLQLSETAPNFIIPLTGIPPGVYIARFDVAQQSVSKRLLIK